MLVRKGPRETRGSFLMGGPPLGGGAGAGVGIPLWTYLSCVSERDPAHVQGSFMGATLRRAVGLMPGSW